MTVNMQNNKDLLGLDHKDEMEVAINSLINRFRLLSGQNLKWALMELYDLGYDHGSTMEGTYPYDS
jgi:hypothetical protein